MTQKMIKKAMVMAAGVGSRLEPLTLCTPKPLVPVANMPVMDILLMKLKSYGIESVIANTHYLAGQIQERYTKNSDLGLNFHYLHETELSGTAGGVKKCQFFFEDCDDFLVVSADGLHDADLNRIIKSHYDNNAIATMAVISVGLEEVPNYGVVVSSPEYFVEEFQEKPSIEAAKSNCINTGIYVFNKRIFDYIPENTKFDFAKDVFPALMAAGEKINTYKIYSYWSDIGTLDQYMQSNFDALSNKVILNANNIVRNLDTRYIAGKNTIIDKSVQLIGNCVIGNNCKIGANAVLKDAILWDNVEVSEGSRIENSVVASNCIIKGSVKSEIVPQGKILETTYR